MANLSLDTESTCRMSAPIIQLEKGRDKPVRDRHPWIFSGAIKKANDAEPGDLVTVLDSGGNFLGRGYYNSHSAIRVRLMTWQDEPIDDAWWNRNLRRAIEARYAGQNMGWLHGNGERLVNAESDYIPGLIVDRYNDVIVLQALTLYIDQVKHHIADMLPSILQEYGVTIHSVYERSDVDVREKEGLEESAGLLWGAEPPELVWFGQGDLRFPVDVRKGHKTGFYLDQRPNHALLAQLAVDQAGTETRILNAFSYTGAFGLACLGHITNVDASADALALAKQSYEKGHSRESEAEFVEADVFEYLRVLREEDEQFDVIVLDPPKFASNKHQIKAASRGYKDINLQAFHLVRPGGYLITFSCSGAVDRDLFQKIVFGALADSGRQAQIVRHLSAGTDHPVALTFPEGEYLKGLLLRVY